jgi:alkanesulfonate monooxygenase SsuD/methylene tetrahydromethanopterin reductase-like flavin-dependent oxidoreductase (luciferase family)
MARAVKFGYMLDFRNRPDSGFGFPQLYNEMFRQIELADQSGLDSIWVSEHHCTDDGYLPSVMPVLAAIAARTRRVTIGSFVVLMPFYHPLRLAEDAAVVDVISGGRLRLGIGKGYRAEEFEGFGIARKERLGRTLEGIEILKRAWTGERFSFEGRYFRFDNVRVLPSPTSKPYPELLWGGMTPKAIRRAAELDMSFVCNLGAREMELYLDALRQLGKNPAGYSIVNSRIVYLADSAEQAWRDIEGPLLYQTELYAKWLSAAAGTDPSKSPIRPDPERLRRASLLGPPAQVAEQLAHLIEQTPMTEMIMGMQLPGLAPAKAMRSLERFAAEVLPALRR